MQLIQWKPFEDVDRYSGNSFLRTQNSGGDVLIDLYEKENKLVATMAIPGVQADNLDVIIDDESLTVSGEREEEKEISNLDYYSKEIRRGSFSRVIQLPKTIEPQKVLAEYLDGVLTVIMPLKKSKKKSDKIEVT